MMKFPFAIPQPVGRPWGKLWILLTLVVPITPAHPCMIRAYYVKYVINKAIPLQLISC